MLANTPSLRAAITRVRTNDRWIAVAAALLLALSGSGAPLLAAETIQPWQVATFKSVSSARISPDGAHVAYVVAVPRKPLADDSGSSWTELHVLTEGEREGRPYIAGETNVGSVKWLDAKTITFLAKRGDDEHTSLYAISTDGGEARKLLEHETAISTYIIGPDGKTVAFLARESEDDDVEKLVDKGFNQEIYEEDRKRTRLFVVSLDDQNDSDHTPLDLEGSIRSVSFVGSDSVVITRTPTPLVDDTYVALEILVVGLDGSIRDEITVPGKLGKVRSNPDGTRFAMIAAVDRSDPAEGRLSLDTDQGLRDLLPDLEGHVADFAWRSNDTLVYVADVGAETIVGEVSIDGNNREITGPGEAIFDGIDLVGDRATLVARRDQHPPELHELDMSTGSLKRLTDSNPWLDDITLARQEVVTWNATDGMRLEGILMYPLEYEEGQRYPLIMVVHGGPEAHYRNGWLTGYSQLGQLAAARGFAVFYPNYRGSTGRGVEFSKEGHADAAGKEFSDLVDGVDHLIDIGLVDRDKVGITGGSYGGYASAWATTYYSDRFAAAIPFVGISNNISKVGTTDIPHEMFEVHHLKWLWDDYEYFLERSPIRYVERNRTPTLILHGKNDTRVHPSQSLELYRHLKVLDQAPVRLVLYPGEGHGNRKSAARFDYLLRTLRWFEHYLQGPGGEAPPMAIDYESELPWAGDDDSSAHSAPNTDDGA